MLKLTHKALEAFPPSNPDLEKGNYVAGWNYILDKSLKVFFEPAGTSNWSD